MTRDAFQPTATNPDHPGNHYRSYPCLRFRDDAGDHAVVLDKRRILGSSPNAEVVLSHATVSRVHAELEPREGGLFVRDLGSRNGIWLAGVRLEAALVPDGSRLSFGGVELLVDYKGELRGEIALWPDVYFGRMFGQSAPMRELFALLAKIAASDAPVLVSGESGTGKELVAESLHATSPRRDGPLVVVDCGALPEHLLEAELFGHTRGAFTGAHREREGAIESARGGTVFLDEIGELPLSMQPKLLRAIETRSIRRIGDAAYRQVDVRYVCATHRDLARRVAEGAFREDLYFRIAVLHASVPPLRDRREDVLPLVRELLVRSGKDLAPPREVARALHKHGWPGNVRELRNVVERAAVLGWSEASRMLGREGESSSPPPAKIEDAGAPPEGSLLELPFVLFREKWSERGDRAYLDRLLAKHGGDTAAVAREAGVDRSYVYRILRRLGRGA